MHARTAQDSIAFSMNLANLDEQAPTILDAGAGRSSQSLVEATALIDDPGRWVSSTASHLNSAMNFLRCIKHLLRLSFSLLRRVRNYGIEPKILNAAEWNVAKNGQAYMG